MNTEMVLHAVIIPPVHSIHLKKLRCTSTITNAGQNVYSVQC